MQEITITLKFKVKHEPGNEQHLLQIAKNYLRPKGIVLTDDKVIEV